MRRLTVLLSALWLCCATVAQANTIDFTTFASAPNQTITIDGVTISGENGALVSILAGVGLGVGTDGVFSQSFTRLTSGGFIDLEDAPELNIHVDGIITAFTILPFAIVENFDVAQPHFDTSELLKRPTIASERRYQGAVAGVATTITMPHPDCQLCGVDTLADVGLGADFGQEPYFVGLAVIDPSLLASVYYGFSITSLDYTPNAKPVPEPGTLALMALGLGSLSGIRRCAR